MRFSQTAFLIGVKTIPSDFSDAGQTVEVKREVYINPYALSLATQLSVGKDGLSLSGQAELYTAEYGGESLIEVGGKRYRIVAVTTKGDRTVLSYGEAIGV